MINPVLTINVDVSDDGAVWVAFGRRNPTGRPGERQFKNYHLFPENADNGRLRRFMERGQRAQAALLERGDR